MKIRNMEITLSKTNHWHTTKDEIFCDSCKKKVKSAFITKYLSKDKKQDVTHVVCNKCSFSSKKPFFIRFMEESDDEYALVCGVSREV